MKDTEFLDRVSRLLGIEQASITFQTVHDETQILNSNYQAVMERYSKICNALSGKVVPTDQLLSRIDELKSVSEYDDGMRKAMQRIARACGESFPISIGYEQLPNLVEQRVLESKNEIARLESQHSSVLAKLNEAATSATGGAELRSIDEVCTLISGMSMVLMREITQPQLNEITQLLERDDLQGTFNSLKRLVELPESAGLTELFETLDTVKYERDLYRDTTQPQLSEIRYVLHGDIQPCTVLYSDDTTTLLRLDEGDMMLETDTIEWSDSVTYRCQELLKSAADPVHIAVPLKTSKLFAQLVREGKLHLDDSVTGVETCDA